MAGGISEALITTQAGLYTASPSLLMRGILGAAADRAVGKLETGALSVVRGVLGLEETGEGVDQEDEQPPPRRDKVEGEVRARASTIGEELTLGEEL